MKRLFKNINTSKNEPSGFILPTVLGFLIIISTVGLTLMQFSFQAQTATIRYSYTQMAHLASKGGIDFAEEEFELNENYFGTAETDLIITPKYRLTFEVQVVDGFADPSRKTVQSTGRVYIPDNNATASFVRDIQTAVIRNGDILGFANPEDYDPLLWLDANEPANLYQPAASTSEQYIRAIPGAAAQDVVEQRSVNANKDPGQISFGSPDLELMYDSGNSGEQVVGIRFHDIIVPQGGIINDAFIQFKARKTESQFVQILVEGIAQDDAPGWIGSYAVDNQPKTTATYVWEPTTWTSGSTSASERVDVKSIVQEIVDRAGWAPNNEMSFSFSLLNGSGKRLAYSGMADPLEAPELYINYSPSGGGEATADGESIGTWIDKSVNNSSAYLEYGTAPVLRTNAINGLKAVEFSNDGILLATNGSIAEAFHMTAFIVMQPNNSTSSSGRFLSAMNSAQANDDDSLNGYSIFRQSGASSNLESYYDNQVVETLGGVVNGGWGIYTAVISSNSFERLNQNGIDNSANNVTVVKYDIDQFYVGGRRSGLSGSDVGANFSDMQVAEIIVYDKLLSCSIIDELENNYFAPKFNITTTFKGC